MPWWGWLLISLLGAGLIGVVWILVWFVNIVTKGFNW